MKRVVIILIIVIVIILYQPKQEIQQVFLENNNDYNIYNLNVQDQLITTKNFNKYFKNSNFEILGIYPQTNYLYNKNYFNEKEYYAFKSSKIQVEILQFEKKYQEYLKAKGILLNNGELNGIYLKKVKVYGTLEQVDQLLKKHSKIKIE